MNMCGLYPEMFSILEREFDVFLSNLAQENLKSEYLLQTNHWRFIT